MNAEPKARSIARVRRASPDTSVYPQGQGAGLHPPCLAQFWPASLSRGTLTSADRPMVAPGCKHVAHFHTGDPLGPLQVIALAAGELDAGS